MLLRKIIRLFYANVELQQYFYFILLNVYLVKTKSAWFWYTEP